MKIVVDYPSSDEETIKKKVIIKIAPKQIIEEDSPTLKQSIITADSVKKSSLFALLPSPANPSKPTESPQSSLSFIPLSVKKVPTQKRKQREIEEEEQHDFFNIKSIETGNTDHSFNDHQIGPSRPSERDLKSAASVYSVSNYKYSAEISSEKAVTESGDLLKLDGKRQPIDGYMEVNQADILGSTWETEFKKSNSTQRELTASHLANFKPVSKAQKKNHNLYALALDAAGKYEKLQDDTARRAQNQRQTRAKYGW